MSKLRLSLFLFSLIITPLSAESRPDFFTSAMMVGVMKYFYMEEKDYIESNDTKHPFASLAQFPQKLRGFSIDQFNHAQLADWYEQLHHGNEMNISYEEIKQQPFTLIYAVYLLTGAFHSEEEEGVLNLQILRKVIHNDDLAQQFLDHHAIIGEQVGEYLKKHVFNEL
ncbi:hypothetical protein PVA45_07110 (plasmid) [Entomospira entomophila]|uniref:Uncharacterized protein n=1 Tax=Entomospira entomophila TaxID=2719988 RepID=A0A968GA24_9SPIO|nr:hypothetical protein [Entomospira entomophilus]NIZ41373.1 hypothetical protein [Entomospira entomophilus]WDI36216.1 hypothetical protein PVA45_07110 [Entomospira entomophilus]